MADGRSNPLLQLIRRIAAADRRAEWSDGQLLERFTAHRNEAAFAALSPNSPTKVNLHNDNRAPLLLIAGGKDHTVPASLTRTNFKLQHKSKAPTEIKEFPGRSHYTVGQDGWEEVADYALDWATKHAKVPSAA